MNNKKNKNNGMFNRGNGNGQQQQPNNSKPEVSISTVIDTAPAVEAEEQVEMASQEQFQALDSLLTSLVEVCAETPEKAASEAFAEEVRVLYVEGSSLTEEEAAEVTAAEAEIEAIENSLGMYSPVPGVGDSVIQWLKTADHDTAKDYRTKLELVETFSATETSIPKAAYDQVIERLKGLMLGVRLLLIPTDDMPAEFQETHSMTIASVSPQEEPEVVEVP